MTIRIAVHALVDPSWGGSFQYAESVVDGLRRLPGDRFETRVWYRNRTWEPILSAKGIEGARFEAGAPLSWWEKRLLPTLKRLPPRSFSSTFAQGVLAKADVTAAMENWGADICFNLQQSWLEFRRPMAQISPVHDLMHLYEPNFPEVKVEFEPRQWLYGNIARHASVILCESEVGKQQLIDSYRAAPDRIEVLPLISPRSLTMVTPQRPEALPDEVKPSDFLFYPAQFWKHKNHVRLLEAIASLPDKTIRCVFTGGTDKNGYPEVVEALGRLDLSSRVHILGYVDEAALAWLYRNARMMVMPTFFGPTNIPPLEAMSLGCPVAVSDIYGMREQLDKAAVYFDPRDVSGIAKAIETLWGSEALRSEFATHGKMIVGNWNATHFERQVTQMVSHLADSLRR